MLWVKFPYCREVLKDLPYHLLIKKRFKILLTRGNKLVILYKTTFWNIIIVPFQVRH
jgi:hypothetical protein